MPIADLNTLDRVLVVGSFLRKDHPLMAQRLRQAAKHGAQISFIDCAADDPLMPVAERMTVNPAELARALAEVAVALAHLKSLDVPGEFSSVQAGEEAQRIAASLASGQNIAIFLGNLAAHSPVASTLAANAQKIAELAGGRFGFLTAGGNTVGGYIAGAVPGQGGKTASAMLAEPLKAYIVLHAEPRFDSDAGEQAVATLKQAEFAVALTSYRSDAAEWADVMLPVAPFTETSGTFINAAGTAQGFKGVAAPVGQSRPAWKVLRVLGNVLQLPDFDDDSSEAVRDDIIGGGGADCIHDRLNNIVNAACGPDDAQEGLQRIADVPIYRSDAIVRRAESLQIMADKTAPAARMNAATLAQLGVNDGDRVRVTADAGAAELFAQHDDSVPDNGVRIAAAWPQTAALGSAFGSLTVERM